MSGITSVAARGLPGHTPAAPTPKPIQPRHPRVAIELVTGTPGRIARPAAPPAAPTAGNGRPLGKSRIAIDGGVLRIGEMTVRLNGAVTPGGAKALYAVADELWRMGPDVLREKTPMRP